MYIVKAEADQIEKIVNISVSAFETDVNVGGIKGECPHGFDSIEWHQQMAREAAMEAQAVQKDAPGTWTCNECGQAGNTGKFCQNCGYPAG